MVATPTWRAWRASPAISAPLMKIEPASALTMPARRFLIVDLPAPFSPTSATTSPGARMKLTSLTAVMPPNRFVTRSTATAGSAPSGCTSARIRGRDAAVDVDDVPGRLLGTRAGEERNRFGDVLGIDLHLQHASVAIEGRQVVLTHLVGDRARCLPIRRPDAGSFDHRVRIDGVDADPERTAFVGEHSSEVEAGRLRGRIGRCVGTADERVLGTDEDHRAAAALPLHDAERLTCREEVAAGKDLVV